MHLPFMLHDSKSAVAFAKIAFADRISTGKPEFDLKFTEICLKLNEFSGIAVSGASSRLRQYMTRDEFYIDFVADTLGIESLFEVYAHTSQHLKDVGALSQLESFKIEVHWKDSLDSESRPVWRLGAEVDIATEFYLLMALKKTLKIVPA